MTIFRHRRTLGAAALSLGLLAAACGSESDTVAADDAASDSSSDTEATSVDDGGTESDDGTTDGSTNDDATTDDTTVGDTGDQDADSETPEGGDNGDSGDPDGAATAAPQVSLPPEEAEAAAEANIGNLVAADDVRDYDVLSVMSGEITSLREVVTGDRPVLLWFWAPH